MSSYIGYWIMEIYPGRVSIPPSSSRSAKMQVQDSGDVNFLEHVQAHITLTALRRGDVQMYLTSPGGTKSQLLARRPHDTSRAGFQVYFPLMILLNLDSRYTFPLMIFLAGFQVYFPLMLLLDLYSRYTFPLMMLLDLDIRYTFPPMKLLELDSRYTLPHDTSRSAFQVYFPPHDASRSGYQAYFPLMILLDLDFMYTFALSILLDLDSGNTFPLMILLDLDSWNTFLHDTSRSGFLEYISS